MALQLFHKNRQIHQNLDFFKLKNIVSHEFSDRFLTSTYRWKGIEAYCLVDPNYSNVNDSFEYFYEILNNAIKKYILHVKIKCKTNKPNGGMPICFVATRTVNWFNETKGFEFLKPDGHMFMCILRKSEAKEAKH